MAVQVFYMHHDNLRQMVKRPLAHVVKYRPRLFFLFLENIKMQTNIQMTEKLPQDPVYF